MSTARGGGFDRSAGGGAAATRARGRCDIRGAPSHRRGDGDTRGTGVGNVDTARAA